MHVHPAHRAEQAASRRPCWSILLTERQVLPLQSPPFIPNTDLTFRDSVQDRLQQRPPRDQHHFRAHPPS